MTTALESPTDIVTDVEFLTAFPLGGEAPAKLAAAAAAGDVAKFVDRLRKWLPKPVDAPSPAMTAWSREAENASPRERELVDVVEGLAKLAGRKSKKTTAKSGLSIDAGRVVPAGPTTELGSWLAGSGDGEPLTDGEIRLLGEALLAHGRRLPDSDLWHTWRQVVEAERSHDEFDAECRWLTAALAFDEPTREQAAGFLQTAFLDSTDSDGTPSAAVARHLYRWLAPFVRCRVWADRIGIALLDEDGEGRLHDVVMCIAAMLRADGSLPFDDERRNVATMLQTALVVVGLGRKSCPGALVGEVAAKGTNGSKSSKAPPRRRTRVSDDEPSRQSDWAALAHLRSDWTANGDSLVVAHGEPAVAIDLAVLGHPLLAGEWGLTVSLDGRPVTVSSGWDCVCWFTDEEVDYLELQRTIDATTRIERQLLLPRDGRFAVLADVVTAAEGVRIDYESRLPIAAGLEAKSDVDTRECRLHAKRKAARVFPLALPQDRVQSAAGWFGPDEGVLRLEQSSLGGLYAPVVIDWAPERTKSLADWQNLTVTESGCILSPHEAAGCRVRVGPHQLLLYRALQKGESGRAVLGLHTMRETVIGRFAETSGEIETLLLVD